jgi:hypothetical protein
MSFTYSLPTAAQGDERDVSVLTWHVPRANGVAWMNRAVGSCGNGNENGDDQGHGSEEVVFAGEMVIEGGSTLE